MEKSPKEENSLDNLDLDQMLRAIRRLGLVDELHPDSEFLDLDDDYEINLSKEDGESYIQKIASQAGREYEWVYDETSSLWRYRSNTKTKRAVDRRTGQTLQHMMEVHPDFKESSSESEIYYHLHPFYKRPYNTDGKSEKINLMILANQLPSQHDAKFFTESNYRKAAIVSEMGVIDVEIDVERIYELTEDPDAERDESGRIIALEAIIPRYPNKQALLDLIAENGADRALLRLLKQITNDCDGLIQYSFRRIHKT